MKKAKGLSSLLVPLTLAGCLGVIPTGPVTAQDFTNLFYFNSANGAHPEAGLVLSNDTLYGTAYSGGQGGTVFAINTNDGSFTVPHYFSSGMFSNLDGYGPRSDLVLSSNVLYGTTEYGGQFGKGALFGVTTDGAVFTNLHSFSGGSDGGYPYAGLVLSGDGRRLYGTASGGGTGGVGTVFAVNIDGTGFRAFYSFTAQDPVSGTNSDGAYPWAGLTLAGETLYGTAHLGGARNFGTVFAVSTNGTQFRTLHHFTDGESGFNWIGGLVLSSDTLYGTTYSGGAGVGTVYALSTNGTGFRILHSFGTNDGAYPYARLMLSGNILYGTAYAGGDFGRGVVFVVNMDGTGFRVLHSFDWTQGANPVGGLILSGSTLYGTASSGAYGGCGTVFSVSLPPPELAISRCGTNVVLTWPTNPPGFNLVFTTNLVPAIWSPVSPGPVVVNFQNVVTNPISGTKVFYRLRQ